jgi:heme A synthase
LGIATVYSGVSLWLAVLHQLCGAILLICTVWGAACVEGAQTGPETGKVLFYLSAKARFA